MHVMGSNTLPGILRMIYNEVAENRRSSKNQEMDKNHALCTSHGDPSILAMNLLRMGDLLKKK